MYSEYSLINPLQFVFQEYGGLINELGGLTGYSLVLVHYIGTVLGNCGGLKGLVDKVVAD